MEIIHLHPNRLSRNINIFLLFIPAILFALILALLIANYYHPNSAAVDVQTQNK